MANQPTRPPIRIRFKFNIDTGDIEEFIIDDNAPDRSEEYHDRVAQAIASYLARHPNIRDAGHIRHLLDQEWIAYQTAQAQIDQGDKRRTLTD